MPTWLFFAGQVTYVMLQCKIEKDLLCTLYYKAMYVCICSHVQIKKSNPGTYKAILTCPAKMYK